MEENKNSTANAAAAPIVDSSSWIDSTATKAVGATIAVGATLFTARNAISEAFFKSMNKGSEGAFADLQNIRDQAINAVTRPAKSGMAVPDAMNKVKEINATYDAAYANRRKMLGINGVGAEMKALKKHQWLEVLFATGAVASVAVGAIVAIASGRESGKKLEHIEKLEEDMQQQRGRG